MEKNLEFEYSVKNNTVVDYKLGLREAAKKS